MDEYIIQLIEMIREAHGNKPDLGRFQSFEEEMEEMEHLFDEQYTSMEFHFGISQDYFPPIEKLEVKHFDILVPEILILWQVFCYLPTFPENLPNKFKYQKMREELKNNHPLLKGTNGIWGIEFCHYDPKECPFPSKYCSCKDYELEDLN